MTEIHFDTGDVNRLALELAAAPGKAAPLFARAIAKTAHDIERDAKILCPVDTGFLKNSISSDIGALVAEIGPTANYGAYVEFGTSRMSPEPYMGPSFDRNRGSLEDAVAKIAGDTL